MPQPPEIPRLDTRRLDPARAEDLAAAVDLLRASLRELPEDERPPPDVIGVTRAPAPPAVRDFVDDTQHFNVGAAAAVLTLYRLMPI